MAERISQLVVLRDRLLGRDELWNERAAVRTVDAFFKLPMPVQAILVGFISRFDPDTKKAWAEALVDVTREYGEDSFWSRASLWFIDGPTRRLTNHKIDHALIDYFDKESN